MEGLKYQLKSISKDKMAVLSFFLPIIMAVLVNLLSTGSIITATNLRFAVIQNNIPVQMEDCLEKYGVVKKCSSEQELNKIVINPADETIGIIYNERMNEIRTILSGDETSNIKESAKYIPLVLEKPTFSFNVTLLPKPNAIMEFKYLLTALVMVTALFIGCTFNIMNIVSEKEEGIDYVNQILPMSFSKYIFQKTSLGFLCSFAVSIITAFICLNMSKNFLGNLLLIALSSFMASIIGLFIAKISENLMLAIVYIKITMIVFIAVPLVVYLFVQDNNLRLLFNIIPSYTVFDGLMKIMNGNASSVIINIIVLILHCVIWLKIYFHIDKFNILKNLSK